MSAHKPDEAIRLAVQGINERDIEAAMRYYQDDAIFVGPDGTERRGSTAVREALSEYIALQPDLRITQLRKLIENGEIALVAGDWTMQGTAPDGSALELSGTNIDIARRQPDGTWKLLIDNPYGLQ